MARTEAQTHLEAIPPLHPLLLAGFTLLVLLVLDVHVSTPLLLLLLLLLRFQAVSPLLAALLLGV